MISVVLYLLANSLFILSFLIAKQWLDYDWTLHQRLDTFSHLQWFLKRWLIRMKSIKLWTITPAVPFYGDFHVYNRLFRSLNQVLITISFDSPDRTERVDLLISFSKTEFTDCFLLSQHRFQCWNLPWELMFFDHVFWSTLIYLISSWKSSILNFCFSAIKAYTCITLIFIGLLLSWSSILGKTDTKLKIKIRVLLLLLPQHRVDAWIHYYQNNKKLHYVPYIYQS